MDQAATFAHALPIWTGKDGLPLSWRHFVYGMRFIDRLSVRSILDMGAASRAGGAIEDDYANWRRSLAQRT